VTQRQLADHLGVTPSYVSHLESGGRNVSTEIAARVGRFLNVRPASLMNDAVSGAPFARVGRTVGDDSRSGIEFCTRLHANLWELEELVAGRPARGPLARSSDAPQSPVRAAAEARAFLGWTSHHVAGEADLARQLAAVQVAVFTPPLPLALAGICTRDAPSSVFVNASLAPARRLFTLAVQLGHLVLHGGGSTQTERPRRSVQEDEEAEEFAYEFLLPLDLLKDLLWQLPGSLDRRAAVPWLGSVTGLDPAAVLCRMDQVGHAPRGRHADMRRELASTVEARPPVASWDPVRHLSGRYLMLCCLAWERGDLQARRLSEMLLVDQETATALCTAIRAGLASAPDAACYEPPAR
jgi:transcriptional regulator with XRE-family HTH domain